jgi:hypothetical protein
MHRQHSDGEPLVRVALVLVDSQSSGTLVQLQLSVQRSVNIHERAADEAEERRCAAVVCGVLATCAGGRTGAAHRITELWLGNHGLSRATLPRMDSLRHLWLQNNSITTDGLKALAHSCPLLTRLSLQANRLTSLQPLARLNLLEMLDVQNNMVSELADVVNSLRRLRALKALLCTGNPFFDRAPPEATEVLTSAMRSLTDLNYRRVTRPNKASPGGGGGGRRLVAASPPSSRGGDNVQRLLDQVEAEAVEAVLQRLLTDVAGHHVTPARSQRTTSSPDMASAPSSRPARDVLPLSWSNRVFTL